MRALLQSFLSTVSLDMDICAQKPGLLSPSNIYSTIFSSPVSYSRGGGVCPSSSVVRRPSSVNFRSQISDMTERISFILTSVMTYARTLMHVELNFGPIQYGRQNGRFRSQTGGTFPQSDLSTESPDLDNGYAWTMSPLAHWCTWPHFEILVQDSQPAGT